MCWHELFSFFKIRRRGNIDLYTFVFRLSVQVKFEFKEWLSPTMRINTPGNAMISQQLFIL